MLTLAINAVDTDTEGLVATVRVIVTTGSYQDITITAATTWSLSGKAADIC